MEEGEEEKKAQPSMMVHNEGGSFQGTFARLIPSDHRCNTIHHQNAMNRCKSQIEAYDAIEGKIKEFGGHIGYFNVTRTDLASLEFNTEQMIPVQNW